MLCVLLNLFCPEPFKLNMQETITVQLGQCGNQVGREFWSKIMAEHEKVEDGTDRRDKFFYRTENNTLVPRTVMIDTEPRAICPENNSNKNSMGKTHIHNNSINTFLTNEGTGASNNWAHGYSLAKSHAEDMMELINRNVETCNNVETIQVIHSCAGGTGSGFSSCLGEIFADEFSKKVLCDFVILPNNNEASDVVVQPYNTVMSLNKAIESYDVVIAMDNYALSKQVISNSLYNSFNVDGENSFRNSKTCSYENMNSVAADVISAFSSSIRFPTYLYAEGKSILNALVPDNDFKCVVPSIVTSYHRKFSTSEIVNNLIKQKSMLCGFENSSIYSVKSIWNVLESSLDMESIARAQRLVQNKINFVDLPYYTTAITNKRDVNVAFNNTTGIRNTFSKIIEQFDKLMKRGAFLETYRKFGLESAEMKSARDYLQGRVENYEQAEVKK